MADKITKRWQQNYGKKYYQLKLLYLTLAHDSVRCKIATAKPLHEFTVVM